MLIGCDPIVSVAKETLLRLRTGRTHVAINSGSTPTAAFVKDGNWQNPSEQCVAEVAQIVGKDFVAAFDANSAAVTLMGDSIYTNPLMMGYAWQKGWIPLEKASLMRAIELNAVAVQQNKTAFEWGCRAAHNAQDVLRLINPGQVIAFKKRETLDSVVERRVAFLTAYQHAAYAQTYQAFVRKVRAAEEPLGIKHLPLTESVARYLFKLMAYKDEYEVARLHSDGVFLKRIDTLFEGDFKVNYHLAPPLLAKRNDKGELQKTKFGPAMLTGFKALARLKGLRGTVWDPFGKTDERREERALIGEYTDLLAEILPSLNASNHGLALELARLPELIKGFGHVKARNLKATRIRWSALLGQWRAPAPQMRDKAVAT